MSMYRSEEMEFYNLIIPRESAWDVMNSLGNLDLVHFIDQDPTLPQINRPFSNHVKRCDEVLAKIKQIEQEMKVFSMPIIQSPDIKLILAQNKNHKDFEKIEETIGKQADDLHEQQNILKDLHDRRNNIIQNIEAMKKAATIYNDEGDESEMFVKFQQIVGVINKEDEQRFKRIIFRVTKGNVYLNVADIGHKFLEGERTIVTKSVFVIVFKSGDVTQKKIKKVVETFQACEFEMPINRADFDKRMLKLQSQLEDTKNLLVLTSERIQEYLNKYTEIKINCSYIEQLRLLVEKEKYLYSTLNLLRMTNSVFQGQLWLPKDAYCTIEEALHFRDDHQSPVGQLQLSKANNNPPTYYKLNDVTWPFQEVVNTYGIPRYREVNPGLSTIITFPFLFGVMFGDIGHGLLLLVFGIYLCNFQLEGSFKIFHKVRYMFLLMGCFSFYNGFIYNDLLSIPLNLFGSCYTLTNEEWVREEGCTYIFGLDPVWHTAANSIAFTNSYKMKQAVIIGVVHMIFGIILKGVNAVNNSSLVDFVFEFVPQFLFLACTFGFMDTLIIAKWLTNFEDTSKAPSIITTMIDMILDPFSIPENPVFSSAEFQNSLSLILLTIALVCAPMMLLPKPLIAYLSSNKQYKPISQQEGSEIDGQVIQQQEEIIAHGDHHADDAFGEIVVHQVIETIEFVLGSVSNTASYLRLWALSLAHSQLSEVFMEMTLANFINVEGIKGIVGTILNYPVFALCTFGVLMCMDLMECFLHALRLQWVEFQSKFYKADGYIFAPFSFSKIQSRAQEEEEEVEEE